jgi:hypothetical protein
MTYQLMPFYRIPLFIHPRTISSTAGAISSMAGTISSMAGTVYSVAGTFAAVAGMISSVAGIVPAKSLETPINKGFNNKNSKNNISINQNINFYIK